MFSLTGTTDEGRTVYDINGEPYTFHADALPSSAILGDPLRQLYLGHTNIEAFLGADNIIHTQIEGHVLQDPTTLRAYLERTVFITFKNTSVLPRRLYVCGLIEDRVIPLVDLCTKVIQHSRDFTTIGITLKFF